MEKKEGAVFGKLSNNNYAHWSFKMRVLLVKENCLDVIEGEKPTVMSQEFWDDMNKKAYYHIVMHLEDNQLVHIKKCKTAREAWKSLQSYHQKSTLSSRIRLTRKIFKAQLELGGNMENHLENMMNWFDELSAMGEPLSDRVLVTILLSSLNEDYDTLITALEARSEMI